MHAVTTTPSKGFPALAFVTVAALRVAACRLYRVAYIRPFLFLLATQTLPQENILTSMP
jgi:hypothetical protein